MPVAPAWLAPRKALPPLPPPNPAAAAIWFPEASGIASNAYGDRVREREIGKERTGGSER